MITWFERGDLLLRFILLPLHITGSGKQCSTGDVLYQAGKFLCMIFL